MKSRPVQKRDPKTGKFLRGRSGNPKGRTNKITITGPLADLISSKLDKDKLARVLLKHAYQGDSKAIETVMELVKHAAPRQESGYSYNAVHDGNDKEAEITAAAAIEVFKF